MTITLDSTRADWHARAATWNYYVSPSKRVRRVWHYPGGPTGIKASDSHSRCLSLVNRWQEYHQSKGWGDIGYNFLVCVHAKVIEGRGKNWVGAHCPGWNTEGYGIQFMAGVGEVVSKEMFAVGVRLAQEVEREAGHDLYDNGHQEGYPTACPGKQIQMWVDAGGPENLGLAPKPELIAGLNVAKLVTDGYLGNRTLRVLQRIQQKRGHEIIVDGKISDGFSLWVASVQVDLNEAGYRDENKRRLVVDGRGIKENPYHRWPESGTTHTLYASQRARGTYMDGFASSPSTLYEKWQRDANNTTSSFDSFLWKG